MFLVFALFFWERYYVDSSYGKSPRIAMRYIDSLSKAVLACQEDVGDLTLVRKEMTPPEATWIKVERRKRIKPWTLLGKEVCGRQSECKVY